MAIDQYILDKLRSNLPFTPSSDQDVFFKALASFLTGTSPIFILNGYAGTGKTTAMAALVGALAELKKEAVLLAPTGRSAKVLMGYAGAPAHTIHKAIYRQKPPASSEEGGFGVFQHVLHRAARSDLNRLNRSRRTRRERDEREPPPHFEALP